MQAGPPNALAPLNIGGKPLPPASKAVRSLILIQLANNPFPGTRSQRELKPAAPGLASRCRVGARKLARSVTVILSVLLGMPPEIRSEGQDGLGPASIPVWQGAY